MKRRSGISEGKVVFESSPSWSKFKRLKPIPFSSSSSSKIRDLPDELVTEILEWLPVNSILRFRCVSKLWSALFKNPTFITNHRLKQARAKCLLLRRRLSPPLSPPNCATLYPHLMDDVLSFRYLDSPERKLRPSIRTPKYQAGRCQRLLGPINGIICIKYVLDTYVLCNPALREYKRVPCLLVDSPNKGYYPHAQADGFGVSSSSSSSTSHLEDDFKIVVMHRFLHYDNTMPSRPYVLAHLYTWKTNSWRKLDDAPLIPVLTSVFFNGICHWPGVNYAEDQKMILSFNMTSEVFRVLKLPNDCLKKAKFHHPRLVVLNNCLGVVQLSKWDLVDIWVMKEYGVKESWTKQFVIRPQSFGTTFLPWEDDTMLVFQRVRQPDNRLRDQLTYDLHTGETTKFQVFWPENTSCGLIYEESLVSLN